MTFGTFNTFGIFGNFGNIGTFVNFGTMSTFNLSRHNLKLSLWSGLVWVGPLEDCLVVFWLNMEQ